ncbi:hypothetical protein [Carboxylicivirga marina]|uniref:Outer membrane protein beta-barrel domain-containing protein n=1 Tax=Carboxylicivirga marina TaxID=2800988 RepID=A0ABS1HQ15_9BACT|nr:hypothetical protein [Carboxylicivirga marina]MBK3519773.1 hypothetical protein [Carboxylicivirga marina]
MPTFKYIIVVVILFIAIGPNDAQSNKKFKRNKGTSKREIKKRQQQAFEQDDMNAFNPKQPMGARRNDNRDDLLWHGETANTVYDGATNISLVNPSRYGLKPGLELSSVILLNYWMPNVYLKKRWRNNKWYVSSKHGLYSATPGLNWANKKNYSSIVDNAEDIPFILSIKNEILVSRLILNNERCGRDKPYIILTGGLGIDFGVPFGDSDLKEMEGHFLANRSPALTGSGYSAYVKARADWQMTPLLMLGGSFKYFRGDFSGNSALEHHVELQTLVLPQFSFSVGYLLSIANYTDTNGTALLPFFDLTYFFGKRQGRQKGLFGKGM